MITRVRRKQLPSIPSGDKVIQAVTVEPSTGNLQFKIFALLWAIATLFHMAHSSTFDSQLNLAFLTLAAFWLVFRPSLPAFVALMILQVFDAVFRMPVTTNHWLFAAFVNLTVLQVLVMEMLQNKTFRISEEHFFKRFSPIVRLEVVVLYFFAVFHKLNEGFFTPATSCASYLLKAQNLDEYIPLHEGFYAVNAYVTLIIEASIPTLLCFRKTRYMGALAGIFFHSVLSYSTYNAFYDFSSVMFACYFLFFSNIFSKKVFNIYQNIKSRLALYFKTFTIEKLVYAAAIVAGGLAIIYALNKRLDTFRTVNLYFFWTAYSLGLTAVLLSVILSRKSTVMEDKSIAWPRGTLILMPLVVFINGIMPYMGLKTENSYAMFSNLRTEGGISNHFIIPVKTQIFDYQKEWVEIISSTDPVLAQFATEKKALVLFEFRNYVNDRRPAKVEYLLNGVRKDFDVNDPASVSELGKNPYLLRKFMKFRPFYPTGAQACTH